jgi:monolysocardiolipin acyltransferase
MGCVSIPLIVTYCIRVNTRDIYSGRILMEAKLLPVIIPMWITGFDQLMPEGRPFPYNYLPRIGAHLGVTFGNPIAENELLEALRSNASQSITSREPRALIGTSAEDSSTALIRQRVTAIIHREVERLGSLQDVLTRKKL